MQRTVMNDGTYDMDLPRLQEALDLDDLRLQHDVNEGRVRPRRSQILVDGRGHAGAASALPCWRPVPPRPQVGGCEVLYHMTLYQLTKALATFSPQGAGVV